MKQGWFEFALENNPLRAIVREQQEVKYLRSITDVGPLDHALHIACGNGEATRQLLKYFPSTRMSAIDRDEELITAAREKREGAMIDFSVQDASSLTFPDDSFDAVFDLADLHNSKEWRSGIAELYRVLKPGGLLIMEELAQESFAFASGRIFKALTYHDYDAMLSVNELREHALRVGFEPVVFNERKPLGLFKYYAMIARIPSRTTASSTCRADLPAQ